MRKRIQALVAGSLLTFASTLVAEPDLPLLTKSNYTGYVPQEWVALETCRIYEDRVEIEHRYGAQVEWSFVTLETREIRISSSVKKAIQAALSAELTETPNGLCDGPSTSIYVPEETDNGVLFQTGGCGQPKVEREGAAANHLIHLATRFCSLTHK